MNETCYVKLNTRYLLYVCARTKFCTLSQVSNDKAYTNAKIVLELSFLTVLSNLEAKTWHLRIHFSAFSTERLNSFYVELSQRMYAVLNKFHLS